MKISGAAIIVTGGASGIGRAMAGGLQQEGARVWALDRDTSAISDAASHLDGVRFINCDVSQEREVESTVATIANMADGIDVLVNCAAMLRDQSLVSRLRGKVHRHSTENWLETIASNLTGSFLMAREVAATMLERKRPGLIVNFSSISRHGNAGQSAYAASKAGIDALTVTWSRELAVYGVRVVAIAPGFVRTPMTDRIPPLFLERIREQTPLKRFGLPEEFAHAIRFVIENEYLNGTVLDLNGGLRF